MPKADSDQNKASMTDEEILADPLCNGPILPEDRHDGKWMVTLIGPTVSKPSKKPKTDSAH